MLIFSPSSGLHVFSLSISIFFSHHISYFLFSFLSLAASLLCTSCTVTPHLGLWENMFHILLHLIQAHKLHHLSCLIFFLLNSCKNLFLISFSIFFGGVIQAHRFLHMSLTSFPSQQLPESLPKQSAITCSVL